MALIAWDAAYELTPAGSDAKSGGDDRIREDKEQVRRRFQAGGHLMQDATPALDGRHAVDAGGAGVSPDIYKSDKATKLLYFVDALIRASENVQLDKDLLVTQTLTATLKSIHSAGAEFRGLHAFANSACVTLVGPVSTNIGDQHTVVKADTTAGDITYSCLAGTGGYAVGNRLLYIHKPITANRLIVTGAVASLANGFPANDGIVHIPAGAVGGVLLVSTGVNLWSVVAVNASMPYVVTNANLVLASYMSVVNCTAGCTITLPAATYPRTHPIVVTNTIDSASAVGNVVTVNRAGADTINGALTSVTLYPRRYTVNLTNENQIFSVSLIPTATNNWTITASAVTQG